VTWSATEALGGFPATIFIRIVKCPIDFATDEPKETAARIQRELQAEIDRIYAAHPEVFGPAPAPAEVKKGV
jgi:hypothetical protein